MGNKFTYFDFIAYIIPGSLLLGVLSLVLGSNDFLRLSDNPAIDTLIFLIMSFVIGGFFHQLSHYSVEPVIKLFFWEGRIYSEIYLVNKYRRCKDPLRSQIVTNARSLFQFDEASLNSLESNLQPAGSPDPHLISHQICQRFDYYTSDHNLAKKGHIAHALYSLYRTMTLTIFIVGIILIASYIWNFFTLSFLVMVILTILSFVGAGLSLMRTRKEGQRYVEGILGSVSKGLDQ